MNNMVVTMTNDESLKNKVGSYIVVKLDNGRTLSGVLVKTSAGYSIKLGTKFIRVL